WSVCGQCTGGAEPYSFDKTLRTSYMDEYATGLDIGFSRDYSLRVNVIRKFDFGGSKTVDVLLPYSAYTDVRSATDLGRDGKLGTSDDGVAYVWSVPSSN